MNLQTRLAEPSEVMKAAEGLSETQRLFIALREAEAAVKTAEEHRDALKAEVRALVMDGENVGNDGFYYDLQTRTSKRFDWQKAAMSGLFTETQAAPFMTHSISQALVCVKTEKP